MNTVRSLRTALALLPALTLGLAPAHAQSTVAPPPEADASGRRDDDTVVLSPFAVDTSADKGYKASNATSGTRLNTAIKDAPMPIEVITKDFIRDIGATDLRGALAYSAGVILQSQNDALNDPVSQDREPGSSGANNPSGVTGRGTGTGTKMRGFTVEQTLRDGFRRQFSTDWINIERIEVVRGPEALLYGVGSFGGVINYLPKRPQQKAAYYGALSIGTDAFYRAELDATGPLGDGSLPWSPAYRLTAAWQQNEDYTEWFENKQFFVSPVFSFKPFSNTEVLLDNEFGTQDQKGVGFQQIRLASPGSGAQARGAQFWPGSERADLRTFRWSGPDTYFNTKYNNHVVDITQKVGENLFFKGGVAYNHVERESRDIQNTGFAENQFVSTDPLAYYPNSTVTLGGTSYNLRTALTTPPAGFTASTVAAAAPAASFRGNALNATIPNVSLNAIFANQVTGSPPPADRIAALRYTWEDRHQEEDRLQYRVEGNYQFEAWGKHSLLVGVQTQYRKEELSQRGFARTYSNFNPSLQQQFSYKNPYDFGVFRYGYQGDGQPDPAMVDLDLTTQENWDLGYYAAYQGRFFKDRITLIGGYRWDRNDARYNILSRDSGVTDNRDRGKYSEEAPRQWSPQVGASFAVTRQISLFGLYSTGLIPNYNQPDGNGQLTPTTAKSYEAGVKLDLFDGRLSGTISAYKIERENTPRSVWWAPAPYKASQDPVDATKPRAAVWQFMSPENVWWAVKNTPDGLKVAKEIFPSGWHTWLEAMATVPAQASGSPDYQSPGWANVVGPNNWGGALYTAAGNNTANPDVPANVYWPLINLDIPSHEQFAVNALNAMGTVTPGAQWNWAGSFYDFRNGQRARFGDGTIGVRNIPHYTGAAVPINDEAKGFDAQFILTPRDNWQILLNYAYTKRKITSQTYQYVKTDYYLPVAQYYYPLFGWGTLDARPIQDAYTDPRDTSTFHVPLPEYGQSLDDTPKHQASLWSNYRFEADTLKGFGFGVGARWEDNRQYYSGFSPDGTGNAVTVNGRQVYVQFWTKERWTFDAMVDYRRRLGDKYDLRVALNVSNLLDDQGRYGFVFAPGRSMRLSTSIGF